MQARKWISSAVKVISATPEEDRTTELNLRAQKDPTVKTLGLSWESKEDVLSVVTAEVPSDIPLTKRNVIKKIATVFHQLGFVSPYVVVAKILQQNLWTRGYNWDDVIVDEIGDKILQWFQQLGSLADLGVQWILREIKKVVTKRIITFVDATIQAYGTVVYLLCEYDDGRASSRLITS